MSVKGDATTTATAMSKETNTQQTKHQPSLNLNVQQYRVSKAGVSPLSFTFIMNFGLYKY